MTIPFSHHDFQVIFVVCGSQVIGKEGAIPFFSLSPVSESSSVAGRLWVGERAMTWAGNDLGEQPDPQISQGPSLHSETPKERFQEIETLHVMTLITKLWAFSSNSNPHRSNIEPNYPGTDVLIHKIILHNFIKSINRFSASKQLSVL